MNIHHHFNQTAPDDLILTGADLNYKLFTLIDELTAAQTELEQTAIQCAKADNIYRQNQATSYLTVKTLPENQKATVATLEAMVDKACSVEREAAYIARAMKEAAFERVRTLRAALSAMQSIGAGIRAETDLAKF